MLYLMLPWIIWAGMTDVMRDQFELRPAPKRERPRR
jgi:hypothetical protein